MSTNDMVGFGRTSKLKIFAAGVLCAALACTAATAQEAIFSSSADALPDAPSARLAIPVETQATVEQLTGSSRPIAKKYDTSIPAGWQAQPLTPHDKVIYAIRDSTSWQTGVGITVAAGYSHLTNGQPNYGTNSGAFAERFGAAAARDISEDIFQEAVLAPMLHEDPRYYVEGDGHSFLHRTVYAVTRPLITRGDNGHQRINGSLLLGYAGAALLTNAYYPSGERNFNTTARTYGGSLGGAALGYFFQEFVGDALDAVHKHKHQD